MLESALREELNDVLVAHEVTVEDMNLIAANGPTENDFCHGCGPCSVRSFRAANVGSPSYVTA
mgnify:FL=1